MMTLCVIVFPSQLGAENWPEWRGPDRNGISQDKGLPTTWSDNENIAWKVRLGGVGLSSPILWGDRLFITSQIGKGAVAKTPTEKPEAYEGTVHFIVEAFQRSTGRRLWEYRVEAGDTLPPVHATHNLASPSCATDGELVYAWFGTGHLVALSMDGKVIWERDLSKEYSPFEIRWGHASSPVLYQDNLILLCDHSLDSYLVALDKYSGNEKWKVDRGTQLRSYSTPLIIERAEGDELIVNSSERIDSYNPSTGELLWYAGQHHQFPIPMPTYHDGVVYVSRGYHFGGYLAVRVGGRGDVSETHIRWESPTGSPEMSSPLYYEGLLYLANGRGIVTCVDPNTGEIIWRKRIDGGVFTASPVAAEGRIYLLSETGQTVVIRAGREPSILARNDLSGRSLASLAISDGRLFIRTDSHLISIGK